MGHDLATEEIQDFLNHLSQQYTQPVKLYLLGGSALCFLGSTRRTVDIDFFIEVSSVEFENIVEAVARELQMEIEIIAIDEFIPLPAETTTRHRTLGNYGSIEVFIFDPYSIALSKLARGFDSDVQDVLFLLQIGIIEIDILTKFVEDSLPVAWDYDIDPNSRTGHGISLDRRRLVLLPNTRCAKPWRNAKTCGPDPLMNAMEQALPELGIPREKVLYERFGMV